MPPPKSRIETLAHCLRRLIESHLLTLFAVIVCAALLFGVAQIRYAYLFPSPVAHPVASLLSAVVTVMFFSYYIATFLLLIPGQQRDLTLGSSARISEKIEVTISWPILAALKMQHRHRMRAGITAALVSAVVFFAAIRGAVFGSPYPLARLSVISLSGVLLLLALWLTFVPTVEKPDDLGHVRRTQGRMLGWMVVTCVLGEAVWLSACLSLFARLQYAFGFLLYTKWAILQIVFLILNVARVLDYWHTHARHWPVRPIFTLLLVAAIVSSYQPVDAIFTERKPDPPAKSIADSKWFQQLDRRIESVPFGPAIVVVASGGGSRAALFTSLVLEGLAREESRNNRRLSEHVVLTSSVSGGSLATAYYLAKNCDPRETAALLQNSGREELLQKVISVLKSESEIAEAKLAFWKDQGNGDLLAELEGQKEGVANALSIAESILDGGNDPPETAQYAWMFSSRYVDDVATDFMAPILRGALTPGVSRGEALRCFWETRFDWAGIDDRQSEDSRPVALFNSCNTTWGTRLTIGFPALPTNFFRSRKRTAEASSFPTLSLSDLDTGNAIGLSEAVRLSSNFPWGFRSRRISGKAGSVNLLDGGMVDNTGLDTVYEVFLRLSEFPQGRQLLSRLARLGVVILEIDSGAKPHVAHRLESTERGLTEPLATYGNALHTNAEIVKKFNMRQIRNILKECLRETILSKATELAFEPAQREIELLRARFPEVVLAYSFQCEHFGTVQPFLRNDLQQGANDRPPPSVMTAWALGTKEKSRVFARFLAELGAWKTRIESQRKDIIDILAAIRKIEGNVDDLLVVQRVETSTAQINAIASRYMSAEKVSSVQRIALAEEFQQQYERWDNATATAARRNVLPGLPKERERLSGIVATLRRETETARRETRDDSKSLSPEIEKRLVVASAVARDAILQSLPKTRPALEQKRQSLVQDLATARQKAAQAEAIQETFDRKAKAIR